jgi:hypothetical protein
MTVLPDRRSTGVGWGGGGVFCASTLLFSVACLNARLHAASQGTLLLLLMLQSVVEGDVQADSHIVRVPLRWAGKGQHGGVWLRHVSCVGVTPLPCRRRFPCVLRRLASRRAGATRHRAQLSGARGVNLARHVADIAAADAEQHPLGRRRSAPPAPADGSGGCRRGGASVLLPWAQCSRGQRHDVPLQRDDDFAPRRTRVSLVQHRP